MVAPYPDLVKTAEETLRNTPYPVRILLGDLQTGLKQAQEEISAGNIQIVISRGGTASLLRQNLHIPVFEIDVSGYDLLRAIHPHAVKNRKIAVIGYGNVINGAKSLAEIMDIDLGFFPVTEEKNIETVVREARNWGGQVIVGDTISCKTANSHGLMSELVRSGPEAILGAVEAAANFMSHMNNEILRNKRLNLILEHSDRGVLYLTSDGYVELINSIAARILHSSKETLMGKKLSKDNFPEELMDAVREKASNKLIRLEEKSYMVDALQIFTEGIHAATLVFLQSTTRIRDLEGILRQQLISRGLVATYTFENIIAQNDGFKKTIEKARKYSRTNSTILLLGETGSGKEMFAQSIHNASARQEGPFVAVNCAALPDNLLESELFGYAEGAFTGAKKGGKIGLFEMAHKGTIFLDEVNNMSNVVQARFLRVLQEKQVMRIGDDRIYDVDVRVIAACNTDLYTETEEGRFRKDLYYRLKVLDIKLPALRKRREDIIPLFKTFIQYFNNKYSYEEFSLPDQLTRAISEYDWPGNVRQLRNFAEKVSVLFSLNQNGHEVVEDLLEDLASRTEGGCDDEIETARRSGKKTLRETEAAAVFECWRQNGGNISKTSRQLHIDRATVRKYLALFQDSDTPLTTLPGKEP